MHKEEILEILCENLSFALRDEPCAKFADDLPALRLDTRHRQFKFTVSVDL